MTQKFSAAFRRKIAVFAPVLAFVTITTSVGCGAEDEGLGGASAVTETVQSELDSRPEGPAAEYVDTPVGRFHRSCVHEVPEAAEIDDTGNVQQGGRLLKRLERCRFKSFRGRRQPEKDLPPPTVNGWIARLYAFAPITPAGYRWFNALTHTMKVPSNPTTRNGQLLYTFTSLLPLAGDAIIQPVLQWGIGPAGGGTKWGAAAWYVDNGRNFVTHSPLRDVVAGDSMVGQMAALSCTSAGVCRWAIAWSRNGQGLTSMVVQTTNTFALADKAVLEAYNLTSCRQLPASGVLLFTNVKVFQPVTALDNMTEVTSSLNWASQKWNVTPNCNYGVIFPNPATGVISFSAQ
ncbi:MAG TPA: hypothetical protein VGF45_17235 [Polyangia bacterium]